MAHARPARGCAAPRWTLSALHGPIAAGRPWRTDGMSRSSLGGGEAGTAGEALMAMSASMHGRTGSNHEAALCLVDRGYRRRVGCVLRGCVGQHRLGTARFEQRQRGREGSQLRAVGGHISRARDGLGGFERVVRWTVTAGSVGGTQWFQNLHAFCCILCPTLGWAQHQIGLRPQPIPSPTPRAAKARHLRAEPGQRRERDAVDDTKDQSMESTTRQILHKMYLQKNAAATDETRSDGGFTSRTPPPPARPLPPSSSPTTLAA